ncbi:MAG: hypothetical protein AAFW81_00055 [Pseudomonadota bacterium]
MSAHGGHLSATELLLLFKTVENKIDDRETEVLLTELAISNEIEDAALDIIGDKQNSNSIRFLAFFLLSIKHRRNKDLSKLKSLIDQFRRTFSERALFSHIVAMYYSLAGLYQEALSCARRAADALPDHSGIQHNIASIIVNYFDDSGAQDAKLIDEAQKAVNSAIALSPEYAKFYATKARLLTVVGDFKEALRLIAKAIDLEDSSILDYAIRIGEYQSVKLKIEMAENASRMRRDLDRQISLLENKASDLTTNLRDSQIRNLEVLGFFAAIISILIAIITSMSTSGGGGPQFEDVLKFGGLLLILFSSLSFVMYGIRGLTRFTPPFVIGIALIWIGQSGFALFQ